MGELTRGGHEDATPHTVTAGVDLTTRYLGLDLRTPLVASAGPLTRHVDTIRQLVDHGASAVVLPSLFEEQLAHESMELDALLETGHGFAESTSGYLPDLVDYNTGPDGYLRHVEEAKAAVDVPVIASLNGTTLGGWVRHAGLLQEAGADAIELNLYRIAADPAISGVRLEAELLDVVAAVCDHTTVPVAVKLGPFFSALAHFAQQLVDAGAQGLVLFNRFYQPDLDITDRRVVPQLQLSTSADLLLPLRWIGILHGRIDASLAATSGVHTAEDVAKALLVGADVVMTTSAVLRHGPAHLAVLEQGLVEWMVEHDYDAVAQLRGSASQRAVRDPEAYERANYLQQLASWSSEP